jgi:serine/threonine protein kinase
METSPTWPTVVGRYELRDVIATGGTATVYIGRIIGDAGFTRPVAVKRLHPHLANQPSFVSMFLEEAHLNARVSHANVISTLDVVAHDGELLLVMEYVEGESLAHLLRAARDRNEPVPIPFVSAILIGALAGLHAAHGAASEAGRPLGLVHRDVSPQNIMVGVDGIARVLDFGIAKATMASGEAQTHTGIIKGKLAYMAPEQFEGGVATARTDIYAASVVLWEGLTGKRLFRGDNEGSVISSVLAGGIDPPSMHRTEVATELDALTLRGLSMDPAARFETAEEMASGLHKAAPPATTREVAQWVRQSEAGATRNRARVVRGPRPSLVPIAAVDAVPPAAAPTSGALGDVSASGENLSPPAAALGGIRAHEPLEDLSLPLATSAPSWSLRRSLGASRRVAWAAATGGTLALITALLVVTVSQRPRNPDAGVSANSLTPSSIASQVTPMELASPRAVESFATPAPRPATSRSATVGQEATKERAKRHAPQPSSAAAATTPDCTPPWYFDARGARVFKPQCL